MLDEAWVKTVRADIPALKNLKNGKPPVYLDNACTTLVPDSVIQSINRYYTHYPGCGGTRSRHWFAEEISDLIEGNSEKGIPGSRRLIQDFIRAKSSKEIIFTMNASYAINMVALGLNFRPNDIVLLSDKEHNSNLIPWLRLQKKGLIKVIQFESNKDGLFDQETFKDKLENNYIRLVSVTCTSNLTGETLPVKEMIRMAHRYGTRVLLDAAQTVPHQEIDVQELDVDFLAFSIHKMCGPRGVGVLYAKEELLEEMDIADSSRQSILSPAILGGGAVLDSTYDSYTLLESPEKFEIGIQNYAGQIAAGEAVKYIQKIGLAKIKTQESRLNAYLTDQLFKMYGGTGWFHILGPQNPGQRGGILTFEVKRPNAVGIAEELSLKNNVMIRDGVFCVHSYINKLFGKDWLAPKMPSDQRMIYRVSLYLYNTLADCQTFIETLDEIFKERSYIH
jgi:cysteine desulfurase / selenocysteine lyase